MSKMFSLALVSAALVLAGCGTVSTQEATNSPATTNGQQSASAQVFNLSNGTKIINATGESMTVEEAKSQIPDIDNAREVVIQKPVESNSSMADGAEGQISSLATCVFDMNRNGVCDNYSNGVAAVATSKYLEQTLVFKGPAYNCYNPGSTSCTATVGASGTYTVTGTFTGSYKAPAEVTIGGSFSASASVTLNASLSTTIEKGTCTTYRIYGNFTRGTGYYTAPFMEIRNGFLTDIGTYTIPNMTWYGKKLDNVATGWYGC